MRGSRDGDMTYMFIHTVQYQLACKSSQNLYKVKIETVTMQMQYTVLLYTIWGGYTFPLGLLMGKRAALRPLMPSAAAFTAPCCAPLRPEPCSGRISETRAQLPTLSG